MFGSHIPQSAETESSEPDELRMAFVKLCIERRLILGLSQQELGDKIGISAEEVNNFEKLINSTGEDTYFKIGVCLGLLVYEN